MSIDQVNSLLAALALAGQIFIIIFLVYLIIFRKKPCRLGQFIINNAIPFALLIALISATGSLYYSQIAKFIPCELCWFQRIFMYPQIILLGLAWGKGKDRHILDYSLGLSVVGTLISLYHNYIYYTAKLSNVCSIVAPCTQQYILGFGYISIPLLALTAFILLTILLLSQKIVYISADNK